MRTIFSVIGSLAITAGSLLSSACSTYEPAFPAVPPDPAADLDRFRELWNAYIAETDVDGLQRDCIPRFIPASSQFDRRGAVIMLHGFSGCPQQFFTLAAMIATRGFDVLLPLHPGHGLSHHGDDENLDRLPQADDASNRYADHAVRMNAIMANSPGERIIVGFSLGGAIALNADLNAPDLYDRVLLFSPMLAVRGGAFVEGPVNVFGRIPGLRNLVVKPLGVRNECDDWQQTGRAGFCDYRLRDVLALLTLGESNRSLWRSRPTGTPIQIIASGDEKFVSNTRIEDFVSRQHAHGPIAACVMPEDVPHELLSPYENIDRQMYWLGDLLNGATTFIVDGRFVGALPAKDTDLPPCRVSES